MSSKAIQIIDNSSNNFNFIFEEYGKQIDMKENPREAEVSNFNEVYCPIRGDLRNLYGVVHEVTHTLDLKNGDTEARKIFGEVTPQCAERLLDEFLLHLTQIKNQSLQIDFLLFGGANRTRTDDQSFADSCLTNLAMAPSIYK